MKRLISSLALTAALCLGHGAQAGVMTFDNPGVIDIDPMTNVATYTEAGFKIFGDAASFLTLADGLLGFSGAPLSLKAVDETPFALASLDYSFFHLGLGEIPGELTVIGLLGGMQVASLSLSLGALASATFGADWSTLTEVTFSATSAFLLDNINAVPEPGSAPMIGLALAGLAFGVRRRRA